MERLWRQRHELAEQEFFGAEFFDGVAEFGGFFEFEFLGGFAHVGFQFADVGVQLLLGGGFGMFLGSFDYFPDVSIECKGERPGAKALLWLALFVGLKPHASTEKHGA